MSSIWLMVGLLLMGPGQQVGYVSVVWPHHLGIQETSGAMFAVDMQ